MCSIEELVAQHADNSKDYIELVNKLVQPHVVVLDSLALQAKNLVNSNEYELDVQQLQQLYLQLSTELYFVADKLKNFEIYQSFAKMAETEAYNTAYMSNQSNTDKKQTVAELQIRAQMGSIEKSTVNTLYQSAYKSIKSKIDSALQIADSIKNVIKQSNYTDYAAQSANNLNLYRG